MPNCSPMTKKPTCSHSKTRFEIGPGTASPDRQARAWRHWPANLPLRHYLVSAVFSVSIVATPINECRLALDQHRVPWLDRVAPGLMRDAAAISFYIDHDEGRDTGPAPRLVVGHARIADPPRAPYRALGQRPAEVSLTAATGAGGQCRAGVTTGAAKACSRAAAKGD